jgi:predicted aspartyl protease
LLFKQKLFKEVGLIRADTKSGLLQNVMNITFLKQLGITLLALTISKSVIADSEKQYQFELHPLPTGTYTLSGELAPSVKEEFLFDTGASMVMIGKKLFDEISKHHTPISTGKIAAVMASGSVKTIPTYTLPSLVLENGCDVGPVEIAVVRGATRNLIGLNALSKLGSITIDIQHGKLLTNECPGRNLNAPQVAGIGK